MKFTIKSAVAVLATVAAAAAFAAVTFDPTSGSGFVGKGDVQLAFGWNNKQLQDNASFVSFSTEQTTQYAVTCEWETETGGKNSKIIDHAVTIKKTRNVQGAVNADPRAGKSQFTGFNLHGYGPVTEAGGVVPQVGESCPMAHASAEVTAVTATSSPLTLSAVYGGVAITLGSYF